MLIDTHIHIGQFYNLYFSPSEVSKLLTCLGIDYYAVSSTTICEENYCKVIEEIQELISIDGNKVLPVMWITPEGLKGNIAWYLESEIKWQCIKIHPFLHRDEWDPCGTQFAEILDIARELSIPILIHTDNDSSCEASKYEFIIAHNPDLTFILAHGRPLEQTLNLIRKYDCVYIDSAFMPIDHMQIVIKNGLSSKLLWGTDMCIPNYYNPNINLQYYYNNKLSALWSICNDEKDFSNITFKNAIKVFQISNDKPQLSKDKIQTNLDSLYQTEKPSFLG